MAKVRIKYVNSYIDRRGKLRHYFRRGSQRGPLPGAVGSAEFMRAYEVYLSGGNKIEGPKTVTTLDGSFGRLVTAYYASRDFRDNLKLSSKKTYTHVLERLAAKHGHKTAQLTHQQANKLISDIGANKPSMANLTRKVLALLWQIRQFSGPVRIPESIFQ